MKGNAMRVILCTFLLAFLSNKALAGREGTAGSRAGVDQSGTISSDAGFLWFILIIGCTYFAILKYDSYSKNKARKLQELKRKEMVRSTPYEERLNTAAGNAARVGNVFFIALEYEVNIFEMLPKAFPEFTESEIQEVLANDYNSSAVQSLKKLGLM